LKSVFEYDNYRTFLKDYYEWSKKRNRKFSFRYFAQKAGFSSHNTLRFVIDGQRNLSNESIEKVTRALKLGKAETQFFTHLVQFNQAQTIDEREIYGKELLRSRQYQKTHPLSELQYKYFSKWYFIVVREMVGLREFKEDPEWIAKHIQPQITSSEAREALSVLQRLKLIDRDQKGRLTQTESDLITPDLIASSAKAQIHFELLRKAAESIKQVPSDRREIMAITFPTSDETLKKIKQIVWKFRSDLLEVAAEYPTQNSIYQLNIQVFPLANSERVATPPLAAGAAEKDKNR
jgi:uncharacterized protein (TIGR02147 family)